MNTKWLSRVGEGLLIGFGASLAFGVFTAMSNATSDLKVAEDRMMLQEEINGDFHELIEYGLKENQLIREYVEDELSKLNENADELALRVEEIHKALSRTGGQRTTLEDKSWDQLKSNRESQNKIQTVTPTTPFPIQDDARLNIIYKLDKSIKTQKAIPFN